MHRFTRFSTLLAIFLALISGTYAQDDLTDESLLLTFIPNVQFAPFYVGVTDGYFQDAGFNVSLEHLNEPEVVDLVAAGQAHFGIVSGEQVILARSQGRDVVYVYEWFQEYPIGIVIPNTDEGVTISDLSGKKVGLPGRFGATYSGLTTLLQSADMTESDIQLEEIGFNAPEVVCLGAIEAAVIYVNNEPLQIRNRAESGDCGDIEGVTVITVASQADLVSNGLIVGADYLAENPDEVQSMVTAFDQALLASINNPAHAYLASLDFVENLPADEVFMSTLELLAHDQDAFLETQPSREDIAESRWAMYEALAEDFDADMLTQFEVLLTTTDLWDAEILGHSDLVSWETMRDTLLSMGMLDDEMMDLEQAFSNQFVSSES